MKLAFAYVTAVAVVLTAAEGAEPESLSFQDAAVGKLPAGWTAARTGQGPGSVWKVVEDQDSPDGGKALAQVSAEGPGSHFNLCVADGTSFTNLDLSVQLKAVAGEEDQGGGLVWRYQDADNYYIARMNPLEDNFRVYKVVNGKRMQLGSADVKAPAGKWHTLRIVQQGDHIQCSLNGKQYLDVKDDTFTGAGKIGLWSKADAQTHFAGLKVSGK